MVRSSRGRVQRTRHSLPKVGSGRIVAAFVLVSSLAVGTLAMAGADDRTSAEALLKEVEGSGKKDVAAELVARARAALDRGARLRTSGDEAHAKLADGVARTWAEAARDVTRAASVEERATQARLGATDAGVLAERERALLEEAIAQAGRVRAQLESTDRERKDQPSRTSAAAANPDAGTKPAPAAPKPPTKETPKADGGAR